MKKIIFMGTFEIEKSSSLKSTKYGNVSNDTCKANNYLNFYIKGCSKQQQIIVFF